MRAVAGYILGGEEKNLVLRCAEVDAVIGKYISQTDLQTLLCDHIKDAIIAVDAKGNAKITEAKQLDIISYLGAE